MVDPKNIYDRPQSSPTDGFLNGIDADLLDCIGKVRLRTGLNPVDNAGTFGYSDNEELCFCRRARKWGWETAGQISMKHQWRRMEPRNRHAAAVQK
jgi:hypothetical protein